MHELKPCPFCGGDATLFYQPTRRRTMSDGIVFAKCCVCDAQSRVFASDDPSDEDWDTYPCHKAEDAWNRRTRG